jgi:uncharacterized protein (DUF2126 family)
MSLAQQLLLRAPDRPLLGRALRAGPLVRWGTELHDRFMLPHFVEQDFRDVMEEMQQAGYPFKAEWFAPHFRVPLPEVRRFRRQGHRVRAAPRARALARDGRGGRVGGTVRYVDSSVERVQVKVSRAWRRRPLRAHLQRRAGAAAADRHQWRVRRRRALPRLAAAVLPASDHRRPRAAGLRPRRYLDAALAGRLPVPRAHPGGRSFDTFPVNAFEAESRRLARFFRFGHTPGKMLVKPAEVSAEHPFTLDLRRF